MLEQLFGPNKRELVDSIFSYVAPKYDLMNDLMSFGLHRLWKKEFCNKITHLNNSQILDVASGTGDIALLLHEKSKKLGSNANITLVDPNIKMLEIAKNKAIDQNILNLNYIQASAENLPFDDHTFDYYTIAFGIRNVTNLICSLKEAKRVLKPGGKFLCMEFGKISNNFASHIYDTYADKIIPKIGHLITKNPEAYRYLVESIKLFPDPDDFIKLMQDAGFNQAHYTTLTYGLVSIYEGSVV